MPAICVVGGCSNGYRSNSTEDEAWDESDDWPAAKTALFEWPACVKKRRKWDSFVNDSRKDWTGGNDRSVICHLHFTPDQFIGLRQWSMGHRRQLSLIKGAVPTIINPSISIDLPEDVGLDPCPKVKRARTAAFKLNIKRVCMKC